MSFKGEIEVYLNRELINEGRSKAEKYLKEKNKFLIIQYGLPFINPWDSIRTDILNKQYSIYENREFGCLVTDSFVYVTKGFNDFMVSEIQSKFGENIFLKIDTIAKIKYQTINNNL